jgi:hypothetical protein
LTSSINCDYQFIKADGEFYAGFFHFVEVLLGLQQLGGKVAFSQRKPRNRAQKLFITYLNRPLAKVVAFHGIS